MLEAEFEPDKQWGKLMAYLALRQVGESPLHYLADVGQLETHIINSYPKRAIAERFVGRLDAGIRDVVITEFRGNDMTFGLSGGYRVFIHVSCYLFFDAANLQCYE